MANTERLEKVVAMLIERDEEFRPFESAAVRMKKEEDSPYWRLTDLKELLGYAVSEPIDRAVTRAKIAASKVGWSIKEHFREGSLFDDTGELYLSKYACLLVTINANPEKDAVSIAQAFFALQADKQAIENEKRLKTRLDVATENRKLADVTQDKGVTDFNKFHGIGLFALYGRKTQAMVKKMKGIPQKTTVLDYAGSEELAANLFRITQTTAAIKRQEKKDENTACVTHERVAKGVRDVITRAGNKPPELLPAAEKKIDITATSVKKKIAVLV